MRCWTACPRRETLSDGLLRIDKLVGPTSHDVVDMVRRAYGMRRVGHAGTLDPFASGLLVVLLGRATRLARYVVGLPKEYTGRIRLGSVTDTDDQTGAVTGGTDGWRDLTDEEIRAEMAGLLGVQLQQPPVYSAKKSGGQRAYRLARQGRPVTLSPVRVEIRRFAMLERDGPRLVFAAEVSSGTYVRGLARDLGERLGCGAHLEELRRTRIGTFAVDGGIRSDEIDGASEPLQPLLEAVAHLPRRDLDAAEARQARHGRPLDASPDREEAVALVHDGVLLGVAERDGARLKPRVVIADE